MHRVDSVRACVRCASLPARGSCHGGDALAPRRSARCTACARLRAAGRLAARHSCQFDTFAGGARARGRPRPPARPPPLPVHLVRRDGRECGRCRRLCAFPEHGSPPVRQHQCAVGGPAWRGEPGQAGGDQVGGPQVRARERGARRARARGRANRLGCPRLTAAFADAPPPREKSCSHRRAGRGRARDGRVRLRAVARCGAARSR